ncbi:MAG: hypothetical protein AB1730_13535 [Myxococcota bacterium]
MTSELEDAVRRAREALAAAERELESFRAHSGAARLRAQLEAVEAEAAEAEAQLAAAQERVRQLTEREAAALAELKR